MTNRETLYELISEVKSSNIDYKGYNDDLTKVKEWLENERISEN